MIRLPLVRGLTVAELLSSVGSTAAVIAISYLAYSFSHSATDAVLVSVAYSFPTAVFGLWAGRLTGRVNHRRLVLFGSVAKSLLFAGLSALTAADLISLASLMAMSALAGTATAFVTPSWMAFERGVIPADRLDETNALFGAATAVAAIAGAGIGGLMLHTVGPSWMFLLDAVSFGGFIVVLARAPDDHPVVQRAEHVSWGSAIRYARSEPHLRLAFGRIALIGLFITPVSQLFPAVADALTGSPRNLGVLSAAFATGAVALAWVIGRLRARYSRVAIVNLAFVAAGIVLLAFGVSGDTLSGADLWAVVIVSLVPLGLLLALAQSVLSAIVQVRVDPELEGAIFGLYAVVFTGVAAIGGLALGRLADARDVWASLILSGAVVTIASAVTLVAHRGRPPDGAEDQALAAPHRFQLDSLLHGHAAHVLGHRTERSSSPRGNGS